MRGSVHRRLRPLCRIAAFAAVVITTVGALEASAQMPPGLVSWDSRTYTLQGGEALQFSIDFDQIPLRRWTLLVEGDTRRSHLNLRRLADGRLVYDRRNESRHLAEVPWGEGEVLQGVLVAGRDGGAFTISFWGEPRDAYLRAYRYEVNRALEELAVEHRNRAIGHLHAALQADPADAIARVLLQGLISASPPATAMLDSTRAVRYERAVAAADQEREAGRIFAAIDTLQASLVGEVDPAVRALLHTDLARLLQEQGNHQQAARAIAEAARLWAILDAGEDQSEPEPEANAPGKEPR